MDPVGFADSARCNILLVPVSPIKRSTFNTLAAHVRPCTSIRLADIPSDQRPERTTFHTSPTTQGRIYFRYLNSYPKDHAFLEDFQVSRKVMGIIGIVDCSEWTRTSDRTGLVNAVETFSNEVGRHPKTLATRCYGFSPDQGQQDNVEGLVIIPNVGDVSFYLGTLLADFASSILNELSRMSTGLSLRINIDTPRESQIIDPFEFLPLRPTAQTSIANYTLNSSSGTDTPSRRVSSPITPQRDIPPSAPQPRQPPVNMLSPAISLAPPSQARTAFGLGGHQPGNQEGFLYGKNINSQPVIQALSDDPSVSKVVDAKTKKRLAGRLRKLEGDLSLLAGWHTDAVIAYGEASLLCKSQSDIVWQASSLEALAVAKVIQVWGRDSDLQEGESPTKMIGNTSPLESAVVMIPYPSVSLLSEINDLFNQAIILYQKVSGSPLEGTAAISSINVEVAHPLIFTEACLRAARFLYCCWKDASSMPAQVLAKAVSGESFTIQPPSSTTSTSPPFATRHTIANQLGVAYTNQLAMQVRVPDRIRLVGVMSAMYGAIGYKRKEAWMLREAAAMAADAVARRRTATLTNGTHHAPLKFDGNAVAGPSLVKTQVHETTGNESLILMMESACAAFGIPVISRDRMTRREEGSKLNVKRISVVPMSENAYHSDQNVLGTFGWRELQVGMIKDAVTVAEVLPDHQGALRFTITALRELAIGMEPSEQYRLSQNIPRIFSSAGRRGLVLDLDYWGPQDLVMALEVTPLPTRSEPFEHRASDMKPPKDLTSATNSTLLSRRHAKGKSKAVEPVLVEEEAAEFRLTLQNPFLFDLEIQSIELSVTGLKFETRSYPTTIPPGSYHTVRLVGTPKESGKLVVEGCKIQIAGCSPREFLLPLWSEEADKKRAKRRSLNTRFQRAKATGLTAITLQQDSEEVEKPDRFLQCTIVPRLPLLRLKSTSLFQGALMLYDGETANIKLVVENTSSLPVDFVRLTFEDSHTETMKVTILETGQSASRVYDISSDLIQRPVFTWHTSQTPTPILPGQTVTFSISVLGKLGCQHGTITVDYAFLNQPLHQVDESSTFYTRQLKCQIVMTVHRTLEAGNLDVSLVRPLIKSEEGGGVRRVKRSSSVSSVNGVGIIGRRAAVDPRLEENLRNAEEGEHCLVSVDVKNVFGQAFDVTFERSEDEDDSFRIRQRVEPGATVAMILRIDRLLLAPEKVAQDIPNLSERQFILKVDDRSESEQRRSKDLFWYREELLKRIHGTWQEVGSLRHGSISMRSLMLTYPMLEILRVEEVNVSLQFINTSQEDTFDTMKPFTFPIQQQQQHQQSFDGGKSREVRVGANEFLSLEIIVTNHGLRPLRLAFYLDLTGYDDTSYTTLHSTSNKLPNTTTITPNGARMTSVQRLSRYVLFDGVTSFALPFLQPKQKTRQLVPTCFLAKGRFELGGRIEEVTATQSSTTTSLKRDGGGQMSSSEVYMTTSRGIVVQVV